METLLTTINVFKCLYWLNEVNVFGVGEIKMLSISISDSDKKIHESILEALPDGILLIDMNGIIKYVNRSSAQIFKVAKSSDIIGCSYKQFLKSTDDNTDIDLNIKNQPVLSVYIKQSNNQYMFAEIDFSQLSSKESIIIIKNTTLSKRSKRMRALYNREKSERLKMAEENRKKSYFYSSLSHELRTPINLIFGSLQVLELKKNDTMQSHLHITKHIKLIKQNCLRMMRIVNNIIDINRIETGFLKVNLSDINIVALLENIIFSASEYANLKYINFVFDTDCEDYHLLCDPELVERIMLNLISNAIKFTQTNGTIWVNFLSGKEFITICVRDSGVGIPQDKLNTIFNRFEQVDNASFVKNYTGSGIGLNLVKEIVQLHGGNITVTSQVNVGSQFTITLPVPNNALPIMEDKKASEDNNVDTINIEMSDIYTGIDAS